MQGRAHATSKEIGGGWTIELLPDNHPEIPADQRGLGHGFHWWATRAGVLWAKGWVRCDDERGARIAVQTCAIRVFQHSDEHRELINALPSSPTRGR